METTTDNQRIAGLICFKCRR
ncbi:hypothetical protein M8C21_010245 [Ambrosia artemisiifolia]|uniref:Uncharacterized protein n=1 Tax=Ambrosia artemisiifolia TaxID=4212 RepID=A0AAD5BTM3_AMBAR|nr:hypothetical protein M8C21_010245 [Ambrosia artemisiifolia]